MVKNVTYHNPINQEEHTPLVTILDTKIDTKQSTAVDSRQSPFVIDLTKAAFGGTYYPVPGTQWYLKKISGVWALMARAPQQNPQLDPSFAPVVGETYIGGESTTHIVSDLDVVGSVGSSGDITTPGAFRAVGPLSSSQGHTGKVVGDAHERIAILDSGEIDWGSGSATTDTNLYRSAANTLKTDDSLVVVGDVTAATGRFGGTTGDAVFVGNEGKLVDVDVTDSIGVQGQTSAANGKFVFGSAKDTNLYRNAADTLKTDDSLIVGIDLTVTGKVLLDSRELPRGYKMAVSGAPGVSSTSASTAAGSVSTIFSSWTAGTNSMTWVNGRIYKVIWSYQLSDNINSSYTVTIPILYSSATSTALASFSHTNPANGHLGISYSQTFFLKRTAGTNLTSGLNVAVQRYISGIAGTSSLDSSNVVVQDAGLVSDNADLAATCGAIT
jgi:hypothetical protein